MCLEVYNSVFELKFVVVCRIINGFIFICDDILS